MDTLDNKLTNGCDKVSKTYCNSYNKLVKMLDRVLSGDEELLQEWDLSSLGLYLCKCVEQEINSSVIQILREHLGIKMPENYCRVERGFPREDATVDTGKWGAHLVRLNDSMDPDHRNVLKLIPLGDALSVTIKLVDDDKYGSWFDDFPFLKSLRFRETWRRIGEIRNRIAHAGAVIRKDELLECVELCKVFLEEFMPELASIKEELAPEGWKGWDVRPSDSGITLKKEKRWAVKTFSEIQRPIPTLKDYYHREALAKYLKELSEEGKYEECSVVWAEQREFENQFNWMDIPFEENGLYGLKDFKGDIIIPARYDDFTELHHYLNQIDADVSVVVKNGKMGLVRRYTGEELTSIDYDFIENKQWTYLYYFRKDGCKALGILNKDGKEMVPCIMDWACAWTNYAGFPFKSGDKYGYYSDVFDFYVPPIYDDIQIPDLDTPIIFIIDGIEGSISSEGVFYTKEELKRMEEEDLEAFEDLELLMEYEG